MIVVSIAVIGCRQSKSLQPDQQEEARAVWQSSTANGAVEHPRSVMVARGPSPLVYQAQQSAVAHISDSTTGREIAALPVSRGSLLWVDESKGVYCDGRILRPGPMPGGHAYTISLDLEQNESWRTSVQTPKPPKQQSEQEKLESGDGSPH